MRTTRFVLLSFVAAFVALLSIGPIAQGADKPDLYSWFDPIIDVEQAIASQFVTEPDLKAMQLGAIRGMIEALGDDYTIYIPSANLAEFNKELRGQYVGIGASVRMEDGWFTIVSPLDNSPANRVGLTAGDRIIAVDGETTMEKPIQASIDMLTGEPGTPVVLTIERGAERFDVTIIREQIRTRTVFGVGRLEDNSWGYLLDPVTRIGYIRVSQFTTGTIPELREALDQLQQNDFKGLVLDLRFNPGGMLAAAVQMADLFLDDGLIVSTRGRSHQEEKVYAVGEGTLPNFPLVVLINRRSASASEVVTGALRDNDRAIVIGARSFGKGSVQTVRPLSSGAGELKITEQHYYGPSGRIIHRLDNSTQWGVDPSPGFYLPMTDEEYNQMLTVRRDLEVIRKRPAPDADLQQTPHDEAWILDTLKDKQLAAAYKAIRLKLERGQWVATGQKEGDSENELAELRRLQLASKRLNRELERLTRRIDAISAAVPKDQVEPESLFAKGADLSAGRIKVFDAKGDVVGELNITGPGLERWLIDAPVEKIKDENAGSEP